MGVRHAHSSLPRRDSQEKRRVSMRVSVAQRTADDCNVTGHAVYLILGTSTIYIFPSSHIFLLIKTIEQIRETTL